MFLLLFLFCRDVYDRPREDARSGAESKSSGFDNLKKRVGSYFASNVIVLSLVGYSYDLFVYRLLLYRTGE